MQMNQKIGPCLWFDNQAEAAAQFYTSIFKNSKMGKTARYTEAGHEIHKQPAGSVMTVEFELNGTPFTALNGGPLFNFNEAVSLQIFCETQEEIDYYWSRLTDGGEPQAQQCGWLKDKFGLSWQVVPAIVKELVSDPDTAKVSRVIDVIMKSRKLVIRELEEAFEGKALANRS